jgi:hypothetical protein
LPRFYSRTLLLLGSVAPPPGGVHGVVGVADLTVGVALDVLGVVNVAHDIRYSLAQFVERFCGIGRKYSRRRSPIAPPLVVGASLIRAMFVRTTIVRATLLGTTVIGTSLFRAVVLCKMLGLCSPSS